MNADPIAVCPGALYELGSLVAVFFIGTVWLPVTRLLAEWLIDGRWRKS